MNIESFDVNKSNSNTLHRTTAILGEPYVRLSLADIPNVVKRFSPTIPRLARIKVTFTDRFGNLYDFQNIDHRVDIVFTSFKQKRKYQNIFS